MSTSPPFFSVIIPTYNRQNVISEAIHSVLQQTFTQFEVIVVDDGSTDETETVVKQIADKDPRIRYVFQENAERSRARNNGISKSNGNYICFLDSDDLYLPEHLQCFFNEIQTRDNPTALFFCSSVGLTGNSRVRNPLPELKIGENVEFLLENPIPPQQVCLHRSILETYLFNPNIRVGEDRELWFRISEEYPLMQTTAETVVIRDLGDRTVDLKNTWAHQENISLINHLIEIDLEQRITPILKRSMLSSGYLKLAISHILNKNRFKGLMSVLRSILIWPSHKYKYKVIIFLRCLHMDWIIPEHIRNTT